jgi:hypothetical protein
VEIFRLAGWQLEILYKCIDLIRAEEATWQTNTARAARLKEGDYRKQMRQWQAEARPIRRVDTLVTVAPAAAEWFAANNIPHRVAE